MGEDVEKTRDGIVAVNWGDDVQFEEDGKDNCLFMETGSFGCSFVSRRQRRGVNRRIFGQEHVPQNG